MLRAEFECRFKMAKRAAAAIAAVVPDAVNVTLFGSTVQKKMRADDIDLAVKVRDPRESTKANNAFIIDTEAAVRRLGFQVGSGRRQIHILPVTEEKLKRASRSPEKGDEWLVDILTHGIQVWP